MLKRLVLIMAIICVGLLLWAGCQRSGAGAPAVPQQVAGVNLSVPAGFRVNVFAEGLGRARFMAFDPRGRLMVADMAGDRVLVLPDENNDGRADKTITFASGLRNPHSIAWYRGQAYVAGETQVTAFSDSNGDGQSDSRRVIVNNLPAGGHSTRTVVFGPDNKMYISVGSVSNLEAGGARRAAILQYNPDGRGGQVYATGLRNAVGLTFNPTTGEMWATDNGRDNLGEDLPPEELDIIRKGGFYGYPYYYGINVPDPAFKQRPAPGIAPALTFQAHSAPLGLAFYTGQQFPKDYRGDVFVCFHGSWNRRVPTGYKIVRVRVRDNKPVSSEDFLTGFLQQGPAGHGDPALQSNGEVRGRPVDVVVGPEGALYFSDDKGGKIYRVIWEGK